MINLTKTPWRKIQQSLAAAFLCVSTVASLQGCVGLIVGGAVVGTLSATDRRTLGAQTEDSAIVIKGETRISKLIGAAGHVNVTSFNRKALLTGEVKDEQMKELVAHEAASIEGVQAVANELEVSGLSSYTSRSNDTLITAKVRTRLIENKDIYANAIKVTTERGIVFLMGRVSQSEGALAAEITRAIGGVQKVVKIFEYLSDEEVKQYTYRANSPMPAAKP